MRRPSSSPVLLGGLAAATRFPGLTLMPALALVGWRPAPGDAVRPLAARLRERAPLALVPAGTLIWFGWLAARSGTFWAYFRAMSEGGRSKEAGLDTLGFAAHGLVAPGGAPPEWTLVAFYLLLALSTVPLVVWLVRRGHLGEAVFTLGIVLPALLTGLDGFGRYAASAFPLALPFAAAATRRPAAVAAVAALCGIGQGLFLLMHMHGFHIL